MRLKTGTKRRFSFTCGVLCAAFLLCAAYDAPGQVPMRYAWWYALEQGKQSFRSGAYGDALMFFEDARRQRRSMYEQMERDFIDLLSLTPVRRMGDSLEKVDTYAREKRYDRAAAALDEAYFRYPKSSFNDSALAVLDALGKMKDYPEAEYWIGETYRLEGELTLAAAQFQKAWDQRSLLEQNGFDTELLYKIADLRRVRQEYNEMERTLLIILAGDSLWSAGDGGDVSLQTSQSGARNAFIRSAMARTLENEGIGRFLTLYRYTNTSVEQAHRLLGIYYYASGRYTRAQEHLMFAFLIQNSVIIEEVMRHEYDFSFANLGMDALLERIGGYPLIAEYVGKTDYYRTAYYLACSLYGNGKTAVARNLWTFLSSGAPPGEWRNRAAVQLRQPQIERVVEMP